ncbi:hypothetical protein [Leptospira santarosai]|uniref:hypothetical protein n=2 Tax=Leptospira santarosai TaxID=28183 RepID=UPI00062D8FB7|nr:hypothetical protein [Leptospira santarosai]AVV79451.1 Uncharacterized protein XB15_01676 [Leptospira santarosai]ONF82963.1 hypothetical protein BWD13_19530 [Leptospira santarosai serovar Grippotyphosa]
MRVWTIVLLFCMIFFILFRSERVSAQEELKFDEVLPGIYVDDGEFYAGWKRLGREKVVTKEAFSTISNFRDAYFSGNLDNFFSYYSEDSFRPLIENYNIYLKKEGRPLVKTTKELFFVWKHDILACRAKELVYDLCTFWNSWRKNVPQKRIKILVTFNADGNDFVYRKENGKPVVDRFSKTNVAAFVVAFVNLESEIPVSQEFAFIKEKGKFRIFDNRQEGALCVFCAYENGEESVKNMFDALKRQSTVQNPR